MSIEEKLDWILKKVKDGKFSLGTIDPNNKNKVGFQSLMEELYPDAKNPSDEYNLCLHEWEQLLTKLIEEDKMIEESAVSIGGDKYVPTLKGKIFHGYQKEKEKILSQQTFQETMTKGIYYLTWAIAVGTTVAALYYLSELCWKYHWFSFCGCH